VVVLSAALGLSIIKQDRGVTHSVVFKHHRDEREEEEAL